MVGQEFLVAHAFGSWDKENRSLGFVRGHSSLGFAKIVTHPITREPKLEVVYSQVYNQSAGGIYAAEYHYHAYSGNFYRGRAFLRPVSDVAIAMPVSMQSPVNINGESVTALGAIRTALNQMMRGYRTGFGHGYTQITLLTSCVHDSGNEVLKTLSELNVAYKNSGNKEASDAIKSINSSLGLYVEAPSFMRNSDTAKTPESTPELLELVKKNLNTSIPRNFQNQVIRGFSEAGSPAILSFTTVQVGSDMKQSPQPPDEVTIAKLVWKKIKDTVSSVAR